MFQEKRSEEKHQNLWIKPFYVFDILCENNSGFSAWILLSYSEY